MFITSLCRIWRRFLEECPRDVHICTYDIPKNLLTLGRDRLGEKPPYYTELKSGIWFSSELSALLESEISNLSILRENLGLYLKLFFGPTPKNIIDGIQQLEPGTLLQVQTDTMKCNVFQYWDLGEPHDLKVKKSVIRYREELAVMGERIFQGEASMGIALSGGWIAASWLCLQKSMERM